MNYTEQLKNYWKSENLVFIATFSKYKETEGFFNDFINPVSGKKLFYPDLDNIKVKQKKVSFYYPNASKFIDTHYYKVDLAFVDNQKSKKNPYSLEIKRVTTLNQTDIQNHLEGSSNEELLKNVFQIRSFIEKDASKEHIRLRFERLNNPEANKIIANLMREIGKGMYSSKQRMIFELLQNADDAPGKEKVEFHIDANGDYLFVMHDGAPFSKDDIEAITSAAESTKRKDKKKTGYKGIGFKSAFTDSTEVWLKSGGYQFAFMRESPLFDDFESFYFTTSDYRKYPGLVADHRKKYQKDIDSYDSSTDIPWQVIPIWQDNLPNEFTDSNFNNFNNPVQFALKVGTTNIYTNDGYLAAIDNIVKRPQFLLFLRNTSKFRSPKNKVTITRFDNDHLIKIKKTTVEYIGEKGVQKQYILEYTKQVYSDIQVNNGAFSALNIGLRKIVEKNDLNEDTYHFVDIDGNKIETIPPKLASATKTEISFGILFLDNKISPEKEYTNGLPKYSSLFTYLPMEDTRFQLPFLVNADFVPSSDRQRIQGDNLWNKYIMIKVAEKHVATLTHFAQEFLKDRDTNSSYLSLLLKNPLPEDDTAQQIITSYNTTYIDQLENTEIVVNDSNQIQLLSNTILDDSGLIKLFGNEVFYEIIETEKRLPHPNLDNKFLKEYDYLNIEVIDLEELADQITPELCKSFGSLIAQNSLNENPELLKWLNELVKYIPDNFRKIPFILHNKALFSLEGLIDEKDAWLINEHTSRYTTLIEELGYNTIKLNLNKYSNIKEYLHSLSGYLNDKTLAYDRIASNSNLHKLPISSKLNLIDFFQNSSFMVGIGVDKYFGKLKLFLDERDNPRPLRQLLSRKEVLEVKTIHKFRIKEAEHNSLPETLRKELIAKEEIFTSFILDEDLFKEWSQQFNAENINIYVDDLKSIYSWVDNPDEISSADWASIPWLFIDNKIRFITTDKVYWSKAFNDLAADKFETIKTILHNEEIKILPVQECGSLIKVFPIKTDDSSEIQWMEVAELEMLLANTLLDWMEYDGGFGDFFKNYTLVANSSGNYKIEEIEGVEIFDGSDKVLKAYIKSNTKLSSLFSELDKNLCSENRSIIGLLQGDRLIKALIESGEYDQNLALHLPSNLSTELLNIFITNLKEFNLFTDSEYGGATPEHFIINRLLKSVESFKEIPLELQNTINILRGKITIDGNPLSNYTISDRVSFGTKEDRKVLKLSDILTEFKGESDVLDNVKESFTTITQKAKLRELIFKTIPLTPIEIHTRIESENSTFYTVYQVVFQLLDKKYGGRLNWSKQRFDDYLIGQGNEIELHNSYRDFLDVLIELPLTELSDFKFHNLVLNNCVDKNLAIESEVIPEWLEEWVKKDHENRLAFISRLGYNGIDSAIVKLRKAAKNENFDAVSVIGHFAESKKNPQITWNTIKWLSSCSSSIITQNAELIKQINNSTTLSTNNLSSIIIPVINSINIEGVRIYDLKNIVCESKIYFLPQNEEFDTSIFKAIKEKNENFVLIDDTCGKMTTHFQVEKIKLSEVINHVLLQEKSNPWDEPFYKKWEFYSECPIYIYDGSEMPFIRTFNDILINKTTGGLMEEYNGSYYFSRILKDSILNQKPSILPENKLQSLKDWYLLVDKNPELIEDDPLKEKYNETFDRMLQDRYGISEERQNEENNNAKKRALYYLKGKGYVVDEGNSKEQYAALYDIKNSDGKNVNFIVRSAKGGLLYLNKEHWDMLESNDMGLIVIYPGNEPKLFHNRLDLLSEELAEKILFRIPNNRNMTELDGVFESLQSGSHIILVTSEKMKESLFSKIKQKREFNKEEKGAIGGDDFKL